MHDTIKKLYNEKGKKRKLYLAGHSLGGALVRKEHIQVQKLMLA